MLCYHMVPGELPYKKIWDTQIVSLWGASPYRKQRGRVVRAPEIKFRGRGFKSHSDHLSGVVSQYSQVQLLSQVCK